MNLRQNSDGTWSEAKPLDYVPGLDWEIDHDTFGWCARAYDGEYFITRVEAKSKFGLKFKMWRENNKRNYEEVRYLW